MEKAWGSTVCPKVAPPIECSFFEVNGSPKQTLEQTTWKYFTVSSSRSSVPESALIYVCFKGQLLILKVFQELLLHKSKPPKIVKKILPETLVNSIVLNCGPQCYNFST